MEKIINDLKQKLLMNNMTWDDRRLPLPLTDARDPIKNIRNMIMFFKQHNYTPTCGGLQRKSIQESMKLCNDGNLLCQCSASKKQLLEALETYTKSVAFAPLKSVQLAFAYANVSEVLFRLEQYEECLEAITCFLNLNHHDELRNKLIVLKFECLSKLKVLQSNVNAKMESSEILHDSLSTTFNCTAMNEEIPAASDFVTLEYSKTYGRHLLAAKDIRPGQIIAKETPYCSVLRFDKRYIRCWGCLGFVWTCIPCDYCSNVAYCSEKCKRASWQKFHDIECNMLLYLEEIYVENERYDNTALRLTILAFKELGNINNVIKEMKEVDQCTEERIKGFAPDYKFYSDKFRSIYSLSSHTDNLCWQIDVIFSVVTLYNLATKTNIFNKKIAEGWKDIYENEEFTLMGNLIWKNLQIQFINSFHATQVCDNNIDLGTSIMPVFSLLNHNCDSNAVIFHKKNVEYLVSVYPIKKGHQIYISYFHNCMSMSIIMRQKKLLEGYNFVCNCIACKNNWPIKNKFPKLNDIFYDEQINSISPSKSLPYINGLLFHDLNNRKNLSIVLQQLCDTMETYFQNINLPCKEIDIIKNLIVKLFKHLNIKNDN